MSRRSNLRISCVLERKEIENYLLIPAALDRAIARTLSARRERAGGGATARTDSLALLDEITSPMKGDVLSQLMARRHDFLGHTGQDKSRLYRDLLGVFEQRWANLDTRVALVPGKEVLGILRDRVQEDCGVTLTDARIAEAMTPNDIPADMRRLLDSLEAFRTIKH